MKLVRMISAMLGLALTVTASAQITAPLPINSPGNLGPNALFPKQNLNGPTGIASQVNYPYEGQCVTSQAMKARYFPLLPLCQIANPTAPGYAPSFECDSTNATGPGYTAGPWGKCGAATIAEFKELWPNVPAPTIVKFQNEVLNPPAYRPDTTTYPDADYYELQLHEAWGYDVLKTIVTHSPGGRPATAFPDPGVSVPNGKQWTGLTCSPALGRTTCTGGVAIGQPIFTPVWGIGSAKNFVALQGQPASSWSANDYVATWPSVSVWAKKGKPVVVKWMNEFPDQHVFCPHPEAADWPCAIDRTFMGVKAKVDVALGVNAKISTDGVNQYGSPQQPDNSWVTHLHGGDIPPSTDGFAEKWFGNKNSAFAYAGMASDYVSPPFENPLGIHLKRPASSADTYTYPMIQDEATIWFHDHTLGKTHHNVIAGPAGFFPVVDDVRHAAGGDLAWLNELTIGYARNVDALGAPLYDLFLAVQDRAFNDDGSINFSNGLGQTLPAGVLPPAIGYSSVTAGANPQVHPVWVPEYFGEYAVVNGVIWPKKSVDQGWYRLRLVDGSDSRCWTIGFTTVTPLPGKKPTNNVPYYVLANDQGYLLNPVKLDPLISPAQALTMCPGERYELLVDFSAFPLGTTVTMTNVAGAPFPAGLTPFAQASPFAHLNVVMQFQVVGSGVAGAIPVTAANNPAFANPALNRMASGSSIRALAPNAVRQIYLNEKVDGVTLAPLGMQLNGVPFEYKVTETPKNGSVEKWQFINLTVDAHPLHPHLVKHQLVSRQPFNVGGYKALLCGSSTCQPGPAPGNEMQVVPDVTPLLQGAPVLVLPTSWEGGWKDASQAPPGMVTTIIAKWEAGWELAGKMSANPTAPGTAGGLDAAACNPAPTCVPPTAGAPLMPLDPACMCSPDPVDPLICAVPETPITFTPAQPDSCKAGSWTYESVSSGPYVWHCHINSHEDSEMMRTSLVVP